MFKWIKSDVEKRELEFYKNAYHVLLLKNRALEEEKESLEQQLSDLRAYIKKLLIEKGDD